MILGVFVFFFIFIFCESLACLTYIEYISLTGTSAAVASDCVSWISAFGVVTSLLIISWSIFIATCVVAVSMYKKVHISRKNEKYTSQEGNETENIYTVHNLDISIYRFPLSLLYVCKSVTNEGAIKGEMERNPAYIPIEMSQIEDKPTYVNLK